MVQEEVMVVQSRRSFNSAPAEEIIPSTTTAGALMGGTSPRDEVDSDLPSMDQAKEFYAKYDPKEVLGRYV